MASSLISWFIFAVAAVPIVAAFVPAAIVLLAPQHVAKQFVENRNHLVIVKAGVPLLTYPIVTVLNWIFSSLFTPAVFIVVLTIALLLNVHTRSTTMRLIKENTLLNVVPMIDWTDYVAALYENRLKHLQTMIDDSVASEIGTEKQQQLIDDHDQIAEVAEVAETALHENE